MWGSRFVILFLEFCLRNLLYFVRPASGEDCSLDSPWSYEDAVVYNGPKNVLVWFGDFKIQLLSCVSAYRPPVLQVISRYIDDLMWGSEVGEKLSASDV